MLFGKLFTNPKMWVNGDADEITMGGVYTCKDVQNVPTGNGALLVFKTENTVKQVFVPVGEEGVVYTRVLGEDWASVTGTSEETEALIQSAIDKANQAQAKADTVDTRLNNIIVESGTSDAEVVAARTDSSGQTFTTLGQRLDTQFSEVTDDLSNINESTVYGGENLFNPLDPDIVYGGYYAVVPGTGGAQVQWVTDDNYIESVYMPVKQGDSWEAWYVNPYTRSRQITLALYDENKNLLKGLYNAASTYTFPSDVAYVRAPIKYKGSNRTIFSYVFALNTATTEDYIIPSSISVVDAIHKLDGSQWMNKKWYAYGTSITNINNEGKYPIYLSALSHLKLTNKGVSGGGIGDLGAYSRGQVYNAICNTTDGKTEAELITLETGANDCNSEVPLGTVYDTGTTTLAGCLNDCIRYLQANTNAQVVIINSPATTTPPTASNKYYEWAKMVREICYINRVHCITPCCNLGNGKLTSDSGSNYVVDNIHQTELGGYIYANSIWTELRNIPLFYTALPLPFAPETNP